MADRRKAKKRKEETAAKPSKQEYAIAKYIRGHLPSKKTTLFSHKVDYFVASKAVNVLLESPWATGGNPDQLLFTTRDSVVEYLNTMLKHSFYHRARKIPLLSKEGKGKKKTDESSDEQEGKKKKKVVEKKTKEVDKKKPEEKKKKKFKLGMHLDQVFVDGSEVYVWIYEPTPWKAWIVGSLFVVGAILLCLFPLWPQNVRKGVYYLSIAAAGFLVFILSLAIIRVIVFCIVWTISFGKHHVWLLPNLTEDVGFLESFWPLYKYEYRSKQSVDNETEKPSSEEKKSDEEEKAEKDRTPEQGTPDCGKRKRKKRKSLESRSGDEDVGSGEQAADETKAGRSENAEHTDTDRDTTDENDDEDYGNFEVLDADDVSDSDSSHLLQEPKSSAS